MAQEEKSEGWYAQELVYQVGFGGGLGWPMRISTKNPTTDPAMEPTTAAIAMSSAGGISGKDPLFTVTVFT